MAWEKREEKQIKIIAFWARDFLEFILDWVKKDVCLVIGYVSKKLAMDPLRDTGLIHIKIKSQV